MCQVSTKIKFCTCSPRSAEKLKHYWTLHRFIEGKDVIVMGLAIMPYQVDRVTDQYNKEILLGRVNEPDAFDVDLNPQEGDRLQLTFTCAEGIEGKTHYGFEFHHSQWVEAEYHVFEWMCHHAEELIGKIQSALKH